MGEKGSPFPIQQLLHFHDQAVDLDSLSVQILQFGDLHLIARLVLERIIDHPLQGHHVTYQDLPDLPQMRLDRSQITQLTQIVILLAIIIDQLIHQLDILIDHRGRNLLIRLQKQLIEREIMLIHLDIRAVPADHLTLDQDIQFILIDNIQRIIIAKR